MDAVAKVVADGLSILGAVASAYLAVGIGLAFLEGQLDAMAGRVAARDIMRRIALLVVCVALVAFARSVSDDVAGLIGGEIGSEAAARQAVLRIGQYFLDIVIGAAAIMLAVGVAMGFVAAQMATMAGQALHLSTIVARLLMIVGLAMGAFFTIAMADLVIGALR